MSDAKVVVNQRQPNKVYRCYQQTVPANSNLDINILTTLGVEANTVSVTNDSKYDMDVIYNETSYDRVPLKAWSEQAWHRDELAIDFVRVINENSEDGRVIIIATG